jgi:hypothetical protein
MCIERFNDGFIFVSKSNQGGFMNAQDKNASNNKSQSDLNRSQPASEKKGQTGGADSSIGQGVKGKGTTNTNTSTFNKQRK